MCSPIYFFLITSIFYGEVYCDAVTTTSKVADSKPELIPAFHGNEYQTHEKQILWKDIIFPKQKPVKVEELKKIANTKIDSTSRRSKILGSLAFLAGLSVGGLAGAASSTVKTYTKLPPVTLNLGASRIAPQFAAIYDPYTLLSQPYVLAAPFGVYPFVDPARLQSVAGGAAQNGLQPLIQNQVPEVLNLLDNKRPINLLNNNEGYIDEAKEAENEKTSSDAEEETDESAELRAEADRNAEEKTADHGSICGTQKGSHKKQSNSPKGDSMEREDLQQDADGSLEALSFRAVNTTQPKGSPNMVQHTTPPKKTPVPRNTTLAPNVHPIRRNVTTTPHPLPPRTTHSSINISHTAYPPFAGYFDGDPQNIEHVDFTTEADIYRHHDYEKINYNLPYERPANFYQDERYNYYSNPPTNSYQSSQFQQEQIPEYFANDFNRLLYVPDNAPAFANGFRPVV